MSIAGMITRVNPLCVCVCVKESAVVYGRKSSVRSSIVKIMSRRFSFLSKKRTKLGPLVLLRFLVLAKGLWYSVVD